jgi:hypothetical protein
VIKKIALGLLLSTKTASAQDVIFTAEQYCSSHSAIQQAVATYDEEILFSGKIFQNHILVGSMWSEFVFSVNQTTGSWTLVNLVDEDTACFVASGKDFKPYSK